LQRRYLQTLPTWRMESFRKSLVVQMDAGAQTSHAAACGEGE
jgi:hypothetical protein